MEDRIRVVFNVDGGVSIRESLNPFSANDEADGDLPEPLNAVDVARLMGFAYRCGQVDGVRKIVKAA